MLVFELMGRLFNEIQKWCDNDSVLVVNVSGLLLRLYCPFRVKLRRPHSSLSINKEYRVTQVLFNYRFHLTYTIDGNNYPFYYFEILGK
jgi:hypothetical protein